MPLPIPNFLLFQKPIEAVCAGQETSRPVRIETCRVPLGSGGRKPEPELDLLSNILKTFNEIFGNINWDRSSRKTFDARCCFQKATSRYSCSGPISAWFIGACALLILAQIVAYVRRVRVVPPITSNINLIGARL